MGSRIPLNSRRAARRSDAAATTAEAAAAAIAAAAAEAAVGGRWLPGETFNMMSHLDRLHYRPASRFLRRSSCVNLF